MRFYSIMCFIKYIKKYFILTRRFKLMKKEVISCFKEQTANKELIIALFLYILRLLSKNMINFVHEYSYFANT